MSLPGKLCVGILEEDNPLRSYFRFMPLLVDDGGRFVPYDGTEDYPEESSIRIVPDKNESYHFKARMRQIGLFSVVDLRAHPGESDKIRPNKNYRPGSEELNASIIYSDVVRAPAPEMIYAIVPAESADGLMPQPSTQAVLLREGDSVFPTLHSWEALPDTDGLGRLSPNGQECPSESVQIFELKGFRGQSVAFAIRPAGTLDVVSDMPEKPVPRVEKPAEPAPAPAPEPSEKPAPAPDKSASKPEVPAEPASEEKPWIHHDESMLPPPVDHRLSRAEQLMAAQAGLNPRRGRSLQELIDEKWQRSRLNQLGQPVTPIATGAPVHSPVENAIEAIRGAWEEPELRRPLIDAVCGMDEFAQTLRVRHKNGLKAAMEDELNSLEAQRLELKNELEHLKADSTALRAKLKQELRQEADAALSAAQAKAREAQAEQAKYEQLADDARAAARDAQGALHALVGDQLEARIKDIALTRRVLERLDALKTAATEKMPPVPEKIDAPALVDRIKRRFEAAGWALTPFEAANLAVCLVVSPVMLFTGAPGSGKSAAARLLAEALGVEPTILAPGATPEKHAAAIILEDANLSAGTNPLRGLDAGLDGDSRLLVTLQDAHSGLPVPAAAWDKGFAVRITPASDLPWQPAAEAAWVAEAPASPRAILSSLPQATLPEAMTERMARLRAAVGEFGGNLSRKALNDTWRYCAAMLSLLRDDADAIFDHAVAQRLLPGLLATASDRLLAALSGMVADLPACAALLAQPLPISI